jgi:hypothetical protein
MATTQAGYFSDPSTLRHVDRKDVVARDAVRTLLA